MQIQYILLESASEENVFELFQDSDITDLAVDSPSGLVNISCIIGLERIVILLSGYPDSKLHGYPTDSDIIKLCFNIIYNHKLSYLSMYLQY